MFSKAIVRTPSPNFARGLTEADLGAPDFETTLVQHQAYCNSLFASGLDVIRLDTDPSLPDSTFVEDTAVLLEGKAVITRPGAWGRRREIFKVAETLCRQYFLLDFIHSPGSIDDRDVCRIDDYFLVGISARTNEDGARQLAGFLSARRFWSDIIDIRGLDGVLHLKNGAAYLGDNRLVVTGPLAKRCPLKV